MHKLALKEHYHSRVAPEMIKAFGYKNSHQIPVIQKVVINSGIKADTEKTWINDVAKEIGNICGQKPVITRAKKSISNFKLRQGMPIGVMVTLRGVRMYEFLYRLIAVALPTIRDFRGVSRKFDGHGNYNMGIADHTIFPEITVDTNRKNIGMDITIVTSAKTDEEGRELLRLMGMPFRGAGQAQAEAVSIVE
jgi:large subunit ribosomal protein L5